MTEIEPKAPPTPTIAGLPDDVAARILERLTERPAIQRVVLYGSRALGRQRSGSDIDLCLDAPDMDLAELMVLGAQLDDLLLPWRIDLQLRHLIRHPGLLEHIDRVGITIA